MANMVATPQNNIVTNFYERLNGVIFKNKTMFANLTITPNKGFRTDIRSRSIAFYFSQMVKTFSQLIALCINNCGEKSMLLRQIIIFYFFERHNRQTHKATSF